MLDRFADACLRLAARRWPEARSEERLSEWRAELDWLRREDGARWWTSLRFGWSLAVTPKILPEGDTMGWREMLPVTVRGARPVLALVAAVAFFSFIEPVVARFGQFIYGFTVGHAPGAGTPVMQFDWYANGLSLAGLAVLVVASVLTGRWLGRMLPLRWTPRGRLGIAGSAILAVAVIALTLLTVLAVSTPNAGDGARYPWQPLALWAVLAAPLTFAVVRLAHSGRRLHALLLACLGTLVVLDLAGIVAGRRAAGLTGVSFGSAPSWFLLTLLDPEGSGIAFGTVGQGLIDSEIIARSAMGALRPLTVITPFLLAYGLAASRAPIASPEPAHVPAPEPSPAWKARDLVGAGFAAAFITLWALCLTVVTGALNDHTDPVGEHHIWAHELRQAAILGIAAALWLLLAGRGPVAAPVVVTIAALLTFDTIADRNDTAGPATGFAAVGTALTVLCGAFWLSRLLSQAFPRKDRRRTLLGLAVFLSFAAPAIGLHVPTWEGHLVPWTFFTANAVIAGLLVTLALLAAAPWSARNVALAVAAGTVFGPLLTYAPVPLFMAGPVLAVAALLAGGLTLGRRWHTAAVFAGAVATAIPVLFLSMMTSVLIAEPLMNAAGYSFPVDGLPLLPGTLIFATILSTLTTLTPGLPDLLGRSGSDYQSWRVPSGRRLTGR